VGCREVNRVTLKAGFESLTEVIGSSDYSIKKINRFQDSFRRFRTANTLSYAKSAAPEKLFTIGLIIVDTGS
jgi:hypothetical protein